MSPAIPPVGGGGAWEIARAGGGEWSVGGIEQPQNGPEGAAAPDRAGGFGTMLGDAIEGLEQTQAAAAEQANALATGQTQDIATVVSSVEEARLSMQLAAQIRNKAVEAYTEIFRTPV